MHNVQLTNSGFQNGLTVMVEKTHLLKSFGIHKRSGLSGGRMYSMIIIFFRYKGIHSRFHHKRSLCSALLNFTEISLQCLLYIEFLTSSGLVLHSVVSLSELEPVTLHGDLCLLDHVEVRYTMMAGHRHRYYN